MKHTKNQLSRILFWVALGCGLATTSASAQTALTQTTLSAAVSGNAGYSGVTAGLQNQVTLASVTGVVAPFNSSVVQSVIYVDREAMAVMGVNTTTKIVTVQRGFFGTQANPHATGTMVLLGQFNNLGQNNFLSYDPSGACTAAQTTSTPWLDVLNGLQWICSTITGTWLPGWGNPGPYDQTPSVTAAVASAAGPILPSGPMFHVTGTAAVTGFTIPVGFNATAAGGGCFTIIPDAIFTWTAAGNIAVAGTAVVNRQLMFCWDATNSKFVPNYVL